MSEPASIRAATPEEIAATYDDEATAVGPSPEAREAWRALDAPPPEAAS